jgi:hypothetical protein
MSVGLIDCPGAACSGATTLLDQTNIAAQAMAIAQMERVSSRMVVPLLFVWLPGCLAAGVGLVLTNAILPAPCFRSLPPHRKKDVAGRRVFHRKHIPRNNRPAATHCAVKRPNWSGTERANRQDNRAGNGRR